MKGKGNMMQCLGKNITFSETALSSLKTCKEESLARTPMPTQAPDATAEDKHKATWVHVLKDPVRSTAVFSINTFYPILHKVHLICHNVSVFHCLQI
jgi:hypothetical protein